MREIMAKVHKEYAKRKAHLQSSNSKKKRELPKQKCFEEQLRATAPRKDRRIKWKKVNTHSKRRTAWGSAQRSKVARNKPNHNYYFPRAGSRRTAIFTRARSLPQLK